MSLSGPPDRRLTTLDRIERLNKTFSSVTVVWSIPDTNNAHISSYEVTVVPSISLPASGVIAADNPLFQTRQLTLTLQQDRQYYITVRAKSCHDTVEGEVSSPLSINVIYLHIHMLVRLLFQRLQKFHYALLYQCMITNQTLSRELKYSGNQYQ